MKVNYGKMMKQVRKMQEDMEKAQEELAKERIEASAGGGMVTIAVNGQQEILEVKISPEAVDADDVEMLEDMISAAANEALRQSKDLVNQKLGKLTGGMSIPGLF